MSVSGRLSDRDRRALRVLLVVAGPLVLWTGGLKPYLSSLSSAREALQLEQESLSREHAVLRRHSVVEADLAKADSLKALVRARLLEGANPQLATASLNALARRLALREGLTVSQEELRDAREDEAGFALLESGLRVQGELPALVRFLRSIRTASAAIRVVSLTIEGNTSLGSMGTQSTGVVASVGIQGYAARQRAPTSDSLDHGR